MATPKKTPPAEQPGFVKTAEVASLLELTPQWVRDLTRQGILKKYNMPAGERYNLIECVKAYIKYLREKVAIKEVKANPWEETRQQAEADLKRSKADMAALQLKELEGKMHRSEDVEAVMTDIVYAIRSMLMALPGRLAVDVTGARSAAEASELIRAEVYKILGELAGYKYDPDEYARRVRDREGWRDLSDGEDD